MGGVSRALGRGLARFLNREKADATPVTQVSVERLLHCLQPGDVLLVEGRTRISTAIKYLTQSTWSHAALYVGPQQAGRLSEPDHCFVEADLEAGVRSLGAAAFARLHTRICRPAGLSDAERAAIVDFTIARLGHRYDLRNVFDLMRYLIPTPPVPTRFRRRMIALGSGDPTRAICSTLIAEAFQSIRYPILPTIDHLPEGSEARRRNVAEVYRIRHHSLFTPRDFDVSPYFRIIKPTIDEGFDFREMNWAVVKGCSARTGTDRPSSTQRGNFEEERSDRSSLE